MGELDYTFAYIYMYIRLVSFFFFLPRAKCFAETLVAIIWLETKDPIASLAAWVTIT